MCKVSFLFCSKLPEMLHMAFGLPEEYCSQTFFTSLCYVFQKCSLSSYNYWNNRFLLILVLQKYCMNRRIVWGKVIFCMANFLKRNGIKLAKNSKQCLRTHARQGQKARLSKTSVAWLISIGQVMSFPIFYTLVIIYTV